MQYVGFVKNHKSMYFINYLKIETQIICSFFFILPFNESSLVVIRIDHGDLSVRSQSTIMNAVNASFCLYVESH